MELVNIYRALSCSFVEIMRLFVVSVCINVSYGIVGIASSMESVSVKELSST